MGLRFQRRIRLFRGLNVNLSKSGIGVSIGGRHFRTGIDAKGRRYSSASLPGTGLSWREYRKGSDRPAAHPGNASRPIASPKVKLGVVVALIILICMFLIVALGSHR